MQGEPPTLDPHWTTAVNTEVIGGHIFEGLYTLDDSNQPIPMLAESHTVSRDGLTYTFKLRQGVPFHNGKELVADDVVASLGRWGKQSIYGKDLFNQVTSLKALDKYTVEMTLKERTPVVLMNLAQTSSFAAIYPKEIAEKFPPATKVTEFIGTGPYRFAEWKPDQFVRVVRFDGYKGRTEKANGYGGVKQAYADEIRWVPVPDVASRVAQMETGELDYADDLSADAYDRLLKSPAARPVIGKLYLWIIMVLNKKEGLMTNQKLRQAMQAALDMESVMKVAAGGRAEFYRLGSSLVPQGGRGLAHEPARAAVQHQGQGEGQGAPAGGRLQGRADPCADLSGVQVDVRHGDRDQAAARRDRHERRADRRRLRHPHPAPQQPHDLGRADHRPGPGLRPDHAAEPQLQLAGVDV